MKKIKDLQDYIQESGDSELKTANKMQQRYKKAIFFYLADAKKKYIANKKDALVLCTGHISKGLEWGSVDIFHDFKNIDKMMAKAEIINAIDLQFKSDEDNSLANAIIQEINLNYVAATRAKHTLRYILRDGSYEVV